MRNIDEIVDFLEELAPKALAAEWDNVGLLVNSAASVTGILCALDITQAVAQEALDKHCNVLVSHHPVIFHPLKALESGTLPYFLVQNKLSAICLHTNLDAANGGVNDTLAGLLQLENAQPFANGFGRIGRLAQPMEAHSFAQNCAALFGRISYTRSSANVQTVALVSGSGGDEAAAAFALGADAFVTGEASHHHALDAAAQDKMLVVAGHFSTEQMIVPVLAEKLAAAFPDVPVLCSQMEADPYHYTV